MAERRPASNQNLAPTCPVLPPLPAAAAEEVVGSGAMAGEAEPTAAVAARTRRHDSELEAALSLPNLVPGGVASQEQPPSPREAPCHRRGNWSPPATSAATAAAREGLKRGAPNDTCECLEVDGGREEVLDMPPARASVHRGPTPPVTSVGLPTAQAASPFHELVSQLEAEHEREVSEWRREASRLRAQLRPGTLASCGLCGDAPDSVGLAMPGAAAAAALHQEESVRRARSSSSMPGISRSISGMPVCRAGWDVTSARESSGPKESEEDDAARYRGLQFYIVIESARGLRNADWRIGDKSDPYCICEVPGKPQWTCHTAVIDNHLNPRWDHSFVITGHQPEDDLHFTVMDKDWGTGDELLGRAVLSGQELHKRRGFEGELKLSEAGDNVSAYLRVKVSAVPMKTRGRTFELHSTWLTVPETLRGHTVARIHNAVARFFDEQSTVRLEEARTYTDMPKAPKLLLHPESSKRMIWDFMGLFVLLADLVWIPMQAFDPPQTTGVQVLGWMAMLYWTLDISASLSTGVYSKAGQVAMDRWSILKSYALSWMALDVALVSIDWAMTIENYTTGAGSGTGVARSAKLARVARIIRLLRLMRLAKLRKILFTVQSIIDSEWVTIVFAVVKNLMTMLAVNHLLACAWFAIGNASDDGWVRHEGFADRDLGLQYVVSLNWSLAQFTPGASPIRPGSLTERYFSVMVLALGLVMATCFMSSITSTMASVWTLNRYNCTQHVLLKKFMKQNKVSRALGSRINRYVDFMLSSRLQRVHASKVHFLSLLSGPLHIELQSELFGPQLANHPCFHQISMASKPALREMCAIAVETTNFAKNDMLFLRGKDARLMWFLTLGSLVYRYKQSRHRPSATIRLDVGSWFCEVALWMPWKHIGEMKAVTEVDIVSVNCDKFRSIVAHYRNIYRMVRTYAFNFRQQVEEECSVDPNFIITDIPFKMTATPAPWDCRGATCSVLDEVAMCEAVQAKMMSWNDVDADGSEEASRS